MNNLTTRNRDNVFDDSEFSIRVLEIPGKAVTATMMSCSIHLVYDRNKRKVIASVFMRVEI